MKKLWLFLLMLAGSVIQIMAFDGYVEIINNTDFPVYYVYISPHGTDSWGNELLGKDNVIAEGKTYRIDLNNQSSSVFDIRIEDVDGDSYTIESVDLSTTREVEFTPETMNQEENELIGEVTLIGSGGPVNGTYYIYNKSNKDILYIFIKRHSGEWGPDLLGENDIFVKDGLFKVQIRELSENIIDLKFEDKRGNTYTYTDIDLNLIRELTVNKEDRD